MICKNIFDWLGRCILIDKNNLFLSSWTVVVCDLFSSLLSSSIGISIEYVLGICEISFSFKTIWSLIVIQNWTIIARLNQTLRLLGFFHLKRWKMFSSPRRYFLWLIHFLSFYRNNYRENFVSTCLKQFQNIHVMWKIRLKKYDSDGDMRMKYMRVFISNVWDFLKLTDAI